MKIKKLFIIASILSMSAQARKYNYRDVPVGERSFGMGTVTMAVPGDVGATLYNPAIMAYQDSTQISASMTSYTKIDSRNGKNVSAFSSAAGSVSERSFQALPAMVGGSFSYGGLSWGGGIFVPRYFQLSSSLSADNGKTGSYSAKDEAVWLGAFAARKWSKSALGLSVFYVSQSSWEKFLYLTASTASYRFLEYSLDTNALVGVLGYARNLNKNLIFGLSLRSPFLVLGGAGSILESSSSSPAQNTINISAKRYSEPWRASLGLSYQWTEDFLVGFDFHYYGANIGKLADTDRKEFDIRARGIPNASIGLEYKAWEYVALRWGFFTNLSSAFHLPSTLTVINDRVHLFGSSGALVILRKTGSVTLGAYAMGGQGKMADVNNGTGESVPRSLYMYGFTVASTFKF